jgi:hypothetical protein
MSEKKIGDYKSPDLSKLQEVIIDSKTKIYIEIGASAEQAKARYLERFRLKKL